MERVDKALAVIRQAIHNEVAGQRFYHEAAVYCIDIGAKDIFANLARDEEDHTQLLLGEYNALVERGEWLDPEDALTAGESADITRVHFSEDEPGPELFPGEWTVSHAIDRTWDDLDALAFGIQLETAAIDLYDGVTKDATDALEIQAFRFLVAEEERHYRLLVSHWEDLAGVEFGR